MRESKLKKSVRILYSNRLWRELQTAKAAITIAIRLRFDYTTKI